MAVSSITILSLPDGAPYSENLSLRPEMLVSWAGGVGPFNVTHEWDTDSAFGTPITDVNNGATSPDIGIPPSDMGGGVTWYYRVTVEDTDDATTLTEPPGGTDWEIFFFDPIDENRYLYLYKNIIPGFGAGEVDDAIEQNRYLYLYKNIIPAFDQGEVDDPLNYPDHLYLYKNITTDQPCPYLENVSPTVVKTGDAITLTGDSFGATQATYDGEVRLYASADFGASFTALTISTWADDTITATIPGGVSTGFVAVVHTNGLETCPGSEFKLLQVLQVEPDPDAGWWLSTTDPENQVDIDLTIIPSHTGETSFIKILNDIGSGQITLPLGDPQIYDFIDPVTRKGVLVRTYLDKTFRYAWFAEELSHNYDEEGVGFVTISGRGQEVVALWNKILPHDFPESPTLSPTWIYGSNENFVLNPGFDDSVDNPFLKNPGGEDGNDDEGNAEGWRGRGSSIVSWAAINDPGNAFEGDWYIEVDANDNHSGIEQSLSCEPNRVYHVQVYARQSPASTQRLTLAVGGASDISATGTYPNNFKYGGEILAELDNVPRNPAANGKPGGSTDGTWQVMDVEVTTGAQQTSLTIGIQDDHHGSGPHDPFWVDGLSVEGWGLGLDPWVPFDIDNHASNSFRLQTVLTRDGSTFGMFHNATALFAGFEQLIELNPNTKYTGTIWARITAPAIDDNFKLEIVKNDGLNTILVVDDQVPLTDEWTQYQVVFETESDDEEVFFRFVYGGPNNPGPIYCDSASLVPGEPPSYAGKIVNDVLDKMAEIDKLTYLQRSFTDDTDSKGRPFPSLLSLDIEPTESLAGLLARLVALGHEWEIVPVNFAEGGENGFELNLYTSRSLDSESGVGINWITDPEGPVIMPGDATVAGRIVKTAFNINTVMAIGDDGTWSRVHQDPWLDADMDPGDPADHGYMDSFNIIEEVLSVGASDANTVAQFAESSLAEAKARERSLQLDMQRSAVFRPFLHIGVGDSLFADLPPTDPDPPPRQYPKRIRAIQALLRGEGSFMEFKVDIDRVLFEQEARWFAMIAQLSERSPAENTGSGTGRPGRGGAVGAVSSTTVVEAGPHQHALDSTEITDKALTGDVIGTLPGPVTVRKVQGQFVSDDPPSRGYVWVWNDNLQSWVAEPVPISNSIMLGGE